MDNDQFDRTLSYGNRAFNLLKMGKIPPTPQFYELLYTYIAGTNPDLNARLNTILSESGAPDVQIAETLYREFLQPHNVGERLDVVSAEITTRVGAVNQAIDNTLLDSNNYSDLLQSTCGNLEHGLDGPAVAKLSAVLLQETRHMQSTNTLLQDSLKSARDDVKALLRELDEVRRESMIDPLTRIPNRKAFDLDIAAAVERASQIDDPLSLILLDIDHFKLFNDNYGHQTGDQVLRLVALTLRSSVNIDDTAARYGGEEFGVIMPGTSLKDAAQMAERLRKSVQSRELLKRSTNEKLGRITASFGVATFNQGDSVTSLVERADRCLYAAKHKGRNSIIDESHALARKHVAA